MNISLQPFAFKKNFISNSFISNSFTHFYIFLGCLHCVQYNQELFQLDLTFQTFSIEISSATQLDA